MILPPQIAQICADIRADLRYLRELLMHFFDHFAYNLIDR